MEKKTKWMLMGGGTLAVIIGAFALFGKGGSNITITTEVVRRGELVQTVEVTGEVESLEDIDLAFATNGNIGAILAEIGDRVTAGQTIAMLDAGDLSADVARAQALLDQQLAGATDEEIAVSEAQVVVAEAALLAAEAELQIKEADVVRVTALEAASVASASLAADKAQDDLDRAATESDLAVAQARQDFVISLESAAISVRSALSDADKVLGRENSLQNNDCDNALGQQDRTTVSAANFAYDNAANARDSAEEAVYAITSLSSDADIATAQLFIEDAIEETSSALLYVAQALDQTVSDTVSCSIDDVNAYKTTIEAARNDLQTQTSAVTNGEQAYELAQVTAESKVLAAQNTLAAQTQSFAAAQITEENNIAAAQAAVTIAQAAVTSRKADVAQAEASLAKVEATPRAVDLASLRADLAAAQARYVKSIITSPIDGILTDLTADIGELASAGTTFATVHANAGQFKIPVDISESDIAKISVGDSAIVTFDAFGDDRIFAATVATINPAEKIIEGVVFYEATIVLTGNEVRNDVRSGMSADVTITTAIAADALYVSQRAVLEESGIKYVRMPIDDKGNFEKRTVTVGMRADDGFLEILNGLTEGELIIVSLKEN
jgi:HlyD family secretion protein